MSEGEGGNPEREQYEKWQEQLFGEFDRLVWQAEELAHRLEVESLPMHHEEAVQLWWRLQQAYQESLRNWQALEVGGVTPVVHENLTAAFRQLKSRAEELFGRQL